MPHGVDVLTLQTHQTPTSHSRHAMLNISQHDSGVSSWWNAAKNRLTLTKEPLATAQQTGPKDKFSNPTLLSVTPPKPSPKGASLSAPLSPTPGAQGLPFSLPPSLVPSPLRPDSHNGPPSRSPSRESPPLYTEFTD
ncbi:hypothetical protein BGY98DRAFT_1093713 [Russula aff. rugulosa BPL654]|nr:hypothetical protein BGY98DRAFT_1093713 [Russula aff. rugulosa BPL654]